MIMTNKRPRLSAQANWGFDNTILHDAKKFRNYTILRVFERGTSQDINELFECYGENVKITLLSTGDISPRVLKTAETIWPNFLEMRTPQVVRPVRERGRLSRTKKRYRLKYKDSAFKSVSRRMRKAV